MPGRLHMNLRLGLLPLLAALTACSQQVEGNGVYAERVFDEGSGLAAFSQVAVGFSGDVDVNGQPLSATVQAGAPARQVILSGDENVIEHIQVRVGPGGRLYTTINVDGYTAVHPPQLLIHVPLLDGVGSLGGAELTVSGVAAVDFTVAAEKLGQVILSGDGGATLEATLSGGATLDARGYPVTSAQLTLTGAAHATVWPTEPVGGSATDGSTVLVKGDATCAVACSGGASCGPL